MLLCTSLDQHLFFYCSSEGVCVVLQMLDLLCKLKDDVIGLEVCGFRSLRFEIVHLKYMI